MKNQIQITKKEREEIEAFADARLGSADTYNKRGGFKRVDLVAGAMGEIATWKLLKANGHDLARPDFTIYEKGQKSFDADLRLKRKRIHVKTQTKESEKRYGKSWLLQRYDPLFKGTGYNHYIVPCVADVNSNSVEVLGYFPVFSILKKGCIGECKVPMFQRTKVAIYFDTLDENFTKHQRWRILNGN